MQAKLTLRLDEDLIEQAKFYAKKRDKSLSQLVADYFALLTAADDHVGQDLPPITRSLRGAIRSTGVDEEDYRKYLEEKHL